MPLSRRRKRKQERQPRPSPRVIKQTVLTKVRNQKFRYPIVCQHYPILPWSRHHRKVHDWKGREICKTLPFLSVVCKEFLDEFLDSLLRWSQYWKKIVCSQRMWRKQEELVSAWTIHLVVVVREVFGNLWKTDFQNLLCISLGIFVYRGNKDEIFLLLFIIFLSFVYTKKKKRKKHSFIFLDNFLSTRFQVRYSFNHYR